MSESSSSAPVIGAPAQQREDPPQRPRSGKGWLWLLVLLIAAAAAYYYWPKSGGAKPGAGNASATAGSGGRGGRGASITPVVAARAKKGDISVYVESLGNVTALSTVTIKSRVDGQLIEVKYKEGEIVQQGAPLVEIDTRPYQAVLEQAEGQLLRDQALLDNANVDLSRYAGLLKQNAIPEQQYATQQALVKQEQGVVKNDQGQIDAAKLNLVYCHIASPITGRVGLRLVDAGNIVHASDAMGLVVITQVQPISVVFTIPEDKLQTVLSRFRAGQKLSVEAWDRDAGTFSDLRKRFATGALATIDNEIDQTTGTLRLRAIYPNTDNALFPNQFVNVRLLVEQKHGVVLIPSGGVQITSDNKYVYLVKPDSTVTVRNITAGTTEGDQTEVVSGLNPGDVVVMQGVDKLNEGSKVVATIAGEQPASGRGSQWGQGGRSGRGGAGKAGRGNAQ
ncbi:MAG TPA: efflux RND transporter periplasmic adaptor subunit [Bryobacteraceae bacterium]|jgi:multidrug efflux system membrane fusion protein